MNQVIELEDRLVTVTEEKMKIEMERQALEHQLTNTHKTEMSMSEESEVRVYS